MAAAVRTARGITRAVAGGAARETLGTARRRHEWSCAYLQKPGKSKQLGNGVRLWKFTFQSVGS
jgi:hypothetical protein